MIASTVRWSPSDLVDHLACAHLTTLERVARADGTDRPAPSEEAALVFEQGRAHEARVLAAMAAAGREIVRIHGTGSDAAAATFDAMRRGAEVIHGAVFHGDDAFTGVADLLERVPAPSDFGDWSYEVVDVKLAASPRPEAIVQLCCYAERLAELQRAPVDYVTLVLGDGSRQRFRVADYAAYVRAAERRFRATLDEYPSTSPEKNAHCERCRWDARCSAERRAADHLSDVAGIRATQIRRLRDAGIGTLTALATAPADHAVPRLARETFATLQRQAAMQHRARLTGEHRYAFRAPQPGRGFARLPAADPGDVWFDMEGDPLHEGGGGLEYLFGTVAVEDGAPVYTARWGHDRDGERAAFIAFVDDIVARHAAAPGMHVYHYGAYEVAALVRLAGRHAVREAEVDALLRAQVFVDLYAAVREALVLSTDDYSIKRVETFYRPKRSGDVTTSMGSVVAYKRWRARPDDGELDAIAAYNRDDCESTRELDGWLRERLGEAQRLHPETEWCAAALPEPVREVAPETAERDARVAADAARLHAAGDAQLGHALTYHQRELRPAWREYFERLVAEPDTYVDDACALGGLQPTGEAPVAIARSLLYVLQAPQQETKLQAGKSYVDPDTRKTIELHAFDPETGRVTIKRGIARCDEPLPRALVEGKPVLREAQREALRDVAAAVLAGEGRFATSRALAAADVPRRTDGRPFDAGDITPAALARLTEALAGSYLMVQGPPGSGKTYTGARTIAALLAAGRTVAVTAPSHRAIHNLLAEVEAAAVECGAPLRGAVRTNGDAYESATGRIESGDVDLAAALRDGANLIGGTIWALTPRAMRDVVDVVVVDEAGQVALADAIAVATCAQTAVLLGDPRQLRHVGQGAHPPGTDVSILEHVLGDADTVPPDRGAFLATTYRLHPAVCAFISDLMYGGRLHAAPVAATRVLAGAPPWHGAGLRTLAVEHDGNARESAEEAEAIAGAVASLLGTPYHDRGEVRPLAAADIMVVAPYNLQVRRLRRALAARGIDGVPVGTVDKFQGQEAAVVFFSMTTSSGDDVPRGVDFLFSRERLNVAISRARTMAVVAYAPALLATRARTVEDIALISALADFAERADALQLPPDGTRATAVS